MHPRAARFAALLTLAALFAGCYSPGNRQPDADASIAFCTRGADHATFPGNMFLRVDTRGDSFEAFVTYEPGDGPEQIAAAVALAFQRQGISAHAHGNRAVLDDAQGSIHVLHQTYNTSVVICD